MDQGAPVFKELTILELHYAGWWELLENRTAQLSCTETKYQREKQQQKKDLHAGKNQRK